MAKSPRTKRTGKVSPQISVKTADKPEPDALTPMNFKVPEEFHRTFKIYAAQNGKSMVQVLFEAFTTLKEQHERTK